NEAGHPSGTEGGPLLHPQGGRAAVLPCDGAGLAKRFGDLATGVGSGGASWTVTDTGVPKRAVLLVSREAHCLHDLLGRVATGELPVRLAAVIGNHEGLGDIVRAHGVPFHHVPFPADGRQAAFDRV